MSPFITLTYLIHNHNHNAYKIKQSLRLLQTLALESTNPNTSNSKNQHHPTISYLKTKCGLSLDSAVSASKRVTITSTHKADSVLQLFKSYNFTKPQITTILTSFPSLIQSDSSNTLKPKFEYLESLGFSKPEIAKFLTSNAKFLKSSLTNMIIPTLNFLKATLDTNENVVYTVKRWPTIVYQNYRVNMEPNVLTLKAHGAPDVGIRKLFMMQPRVFIVRNDLFEDRLRRVEQLGIGPQSLAYFRSVRIMLSMGYSLWEKKVNLFKSYGWSDENVIAAFKLQPNFIAGSETKIRMLMYFYLNKLGLKSSDIARYPNLLLLSLEKRIIPRCSVLQVLLDKNLIGSDLKIPSTLNLMKMVFEEKFVTRYQEIVPEIVSVYKGEIQKGNLKECI